jgi:hypothetical protein
LLLSGGHERNLRLATGRHPEASDSSPWTIESESRR